MDFLKVSKKIIIYALAAYQIFGGVLGIGLALKIMSPLKNYSSGGLSIMLFGGLLYLFSIICGFVLFKDFRRGLSLSLVNQVLQVLNFSIGSYAYNYVAGFKLGLGIDFFPAWQLKLNLSLSSFQFFLNTETGKVFVGLNLLALLLIYLIEKLGDVPEDAKI